MLRRIGLPSIRRQGLFDINRFRGDTMTMPMERRKKKGDGEVKKEQRKEDEEKRSAFSWGFKCRTAVASNPNPVCCLTNRIQTNPFCISNHYRLSPHEHFPKKMHFPGFQPTHRSFQFMGDPTWMIFLHVQTNDKD